MANTGYKINPQVIQIFTTGPSSGSIVTSSFTVTFDSGSDFISSSLCNQLFYYKTYDPYNCVVPSLCIPPILGSVTSQYCNSSYNYVYQFVLDAGTGSLPGIRVEYSLNSSFTGEVKGTTITDYSGSILSPLSVNISNGLTNRTETSSSGLISLPLNQYTPVYFRSYTICSGSNSSSYSNIQNYQCPTPVQNINYRMEECETGFSYNSPKGGSDFGIGDVVEFIITNNPALIHCGTISSTTYPNGSEDAHITGLLRDCGDDIHCGIPNPNLQEE